ncbi:MAG: hypothetical protein WCB12_17555 [Bryobacteraceae bacterium]
MELLQAFRSAIEYLNDAEAGTLSKINQVYKDYRVLQPTRVDLNLGGNSGNLSVNYAVTGVEQFQPYRIQNQVPQPVTAQQPAPAPPAAPTAPTPTPAALAPASPASPQAAAPTIPSTPPASPAATTSTPPPEYVGNFHVHHFTHGTVFAGFAFDSISNRSYSLAACSSADCLSSSSNAPVDVIAQSSEKPGKAVVLGLDIYFTPQDMYPEVRRTRINEYLPSGFVFGASVDPLNQYFFGVAAEPKRGFMYSFGYVLGQQNRLPAGQYPGEQVPYSNAGGTAAPSYTAPTLGSATGFRNGVFVMAAFDLNIFQTVFSKVFGGLTNLGPPSAGTGSQ